jgi:hypothetical protein
MKSVFRTFSVVAVGVLMGGLVFPSQVMAQAFARSGTMEFILPVIYSPSQTVGGQGGSSADLNSDLGLGFGFGYNLNNHFQVNGIFNWSTRNYNANIVQDNGVTRKATGTLDTSTIAINAVYYLMSSNFTPFVSAGIGSVFVDSNIPNGAQGSSACWYDPFYGYVCNTYQPTKTYTSVSYTGGLGVRWDMSRQFATQASYNKLWLDSNSTKEFDGWRLDFIFRM